VKTLREFLDELIRQQLESATTEEQLAKISDGVPGQSESLIATLPKNLPSSIKALAGNRLAESRAIDAGFVERNTLRWKEGFDLLELQIDIAIETGESFNARIRPEAVQQGNLLFDVLVRLHAKGCLISKEVFTLLKNGYADGAHARWRSLHEISVTAMFLAKHGKDAAKRYVDHELIENYKGATTLNKYASRLNPSEFSNAELDEFKSQQEAVLKFYGKEFGNSYGWAAPFINENKLNPNFFDLEKAVGLDHWRPYYKLASQNIHATVKTISRSLGLSEAVNDVLQVGPSNSGMTDPAHCTAISLSQLTSTLLLSEPTLDGIVLTKILVSLSDEIGNAFIECGKKTAT
jgi:Family of unknown function (DUF5677)